jgi:uncharacterized protein (DUF486 family)
LIQDPGGKSDIIYRAGLLLACSNAFKLDYLWAALCLVGAAYFVFRSHS